MRKLYIISASYCPLCKNLKAELEEKAEKQKDQIEEIKADENYVRAKKIAKENITALPVVCLYEDEEHVKTYKAPILPKPEVFAGWLAGGAFLGARWLANEQGTIS